jgi:hypothetical protein
VGTCAGTGRDTAITVLIPGLLSDAAASARKSRKRRQRALIRYRMSPGTEAVVEARIISRYGVNPVASVWHCIEARPMPSAQLEWASMPLNKSWLGREYHLVA